MNIAIRDGRHVDDSLAPVWAKLHDQGLAGMTILGRHLLETGRLRDGIDLAEVRDMLWNYLAIDHYERLVLNQGWSQERYARWLAHAVTSARYERWLAHAVTSARYERWLAHAVTSALGP